jgi:hypothetical protein
MSAVKLIGSLDRRHPGLAVIGVEAESRIPAGNRLMLRLRGGRRHAVRPRGDLSRCRPGRRPPGPALKATRLFGLETGRLYALTMLALPKLLTALLYTNWLFRQKPPSYPTPA